MSICNLCKTDLTDNNLCVNSNCPNKINVFEKATIIPGALPGNNLNEMPENQKDFESEESSNFQKSNVFNLNKSSLLRFSFRNRCSFILIKFKPGLCCTDSLSVVDKT